MGILSAPSVEHDFQMALCTVQNAEPQSLLKGLHQYYQILLQKIGEN